MIGLGLDTPLRMELTDVNGVLTGTGGASFMDCKFFVYWVVSQSHFLGHHGKPPRASSRTNNGPQICEICRPVSPPERHSWEMLTSAVGVDLELAYQFNKMPDLKRPVTLRVVGATYRYRSPLVGAFPRGRWSQERTR